MARKSEMIGPFEKRPLEKNGNDVKTKEKVLVL